MGLDPDICCRAIHARDRRFDGRFFTGVTSTGIYCRPICPARTPSRANCTFFRCAAYAAMWLWRHLADPPLETP